MGNDVNCQKFCDHKEQQNHRQALSEIKMNQYPLQCEICHKQVEHKDFKMHLDVHHYASIQQKHGQIAVVCNLCEKSSQKLLDHQIHLEQKHNYLIKKSHTTPQTGYSDIDDQNQTKKLSSRQIKSKLKQIDTISKIRVLSQINQNKWLVEYKGRQYEMEKHFKQYDGMEYDQNNVFSELVLAPIILKSLNTAKFYRIETAPLERTILCNSLILSEIR